MNMIQKDYIEQIEGENEILKQKLDDALRKYDELYNDRDNLKERIREIDIEEMGNPVGVPTKYKIYNESFQDIQNMHGVVSYKEIAKQTGLSVEEVYKLMELYQKESYDV